MRAFRAADFARACARAGRLRGISCLRGVPSLRSRGLRRLAAVLLRAGFGDLHLARHGVCRIGALQDIALFIHRHELEGSAALELVGVQVDAVKLGHGDDIVLGDASCRTVVADFQHRAFIAVFAMDVDDAHTGRRDAVDTLEEGGIQVMVGVMGDVHRLGVAAVVGQVGRFMDGDGLQGRAGDGLLVMIQRLEGEGPPVVLGGIPGDVLEVLEADFTAFFQRGVGVAALVDEQGGFCRVGVSRFIDFPDADEGRCIVGSRALEEGFTQGLLDVLTNIDGLGVAFLIPGRCGGFVDADGLGLHLGGVVVSVAFFGAHRNEAEFTALGGAGVPAQLLELVGGDDLIGLHVLAIQFQRARLDVQDLHGTGRVIGIAALEDGGVKLGGRVVGHLEGVLGLVLGQVLGRLRVGLVLSVTLVLGVTLMGVLDRLLVAALGGLAALLRVCIRFGRGRLRRCRGLLHLGRFGDGDVVRLGVGQRLGCFGVIAVHSLEADGTGLAVGGVPDQLVEVFGVDDLAFLHGFAVQGQRGLVVVVFDDEAGQFGFGALGDGLGLVAGVIGAGGDHGVAFVQLVAADPGGLAVVVVLALMAQALEVLVQPVQFLLVIDGQQLAAQFFGMGLGFGQGHRGLAFDDFVGRQHGLATLGSTTLGLLLAFGRQGAEHEGAGGAETMCIGVMIGAGRLFGAFVAVADGTRVGVFAFGCLDVGDLDELDRGVCAGGVLEHRLQVGEFRLTGFGHLGGVRLALGNGRAGRDGLDRLLGRRLGCGRVGRGVGSRGRGGCFRDRRLLGSRGRRCSGLLRVGRNVADGRFHGQGGAGGAVAATAAATTGCSGHDGQAQYAATNGQRAESGSGRAGAGFGSHAAGCGSVCGHGAFGAGHLGGRSVFGNSLGVGVGHFSGLFGLGLSRLAGGQLVQRIHVMRLGAGSAGCRSLGLRRLFGHVVLGCHVGLSHERDDGVVSMSWRSVSGMVVCRCWRSVRCLSWLSALGSGMPNVRARHRESSWQFSPHFVEGRRRAVAGGRRVREGAGMRI